MIELHFKNTEDEKKLSVSFTNEEWDIVKNFVFKDSLTFLDDCLSGANEDQDFPFDFFSENEIKMFTEIKNQDIIELFRNKLKLITQF